MKDKLAIFDLDGTLFDTRSVNYQAYMDAFCTCGYSTNLTIEDYSTSYAGVHYKKFLSTLFKNISAKDIERIHREKMNNYSNYVHLALKNDHLFSIIAALRDNYSIALVTSASKDNTHEILKYFNVQNTFDFIIAQEDVSEHKPSPQCFQLAMARANVSPANTLIFEDSNTGLSAARRSKAKYLQVYGFN